MKKKFTSIILLAAMASMLAMGCGSARNLPNPSPAPKPDGK